MKLSLLAVLEQSLRGVDRLVALAAPALRDAIAVLLDERLAQHLATTPVCIGTAASSADPGRSAAGRDLLRRLCDESGIARDSGKRFNLPVGHASFLIAVAHAVDWIQAGREQFVLVGGVDSYLDAATLERLDEAGRLHSDQNRDGFIPGEGAAFCLLTSLDTAARLRLEPFAIVLTPASTTEPFPFTSDGVCTGQGLTEALRAALAAADNAKADWTLCDMNGESFRAAEWIYAYLRTGRQHADPLELWHPADCYGDIGAASGAVLTTLAIAAWRRNYARGNRALVWTSSDGHERSAVVLEAP
jgi:3-oxoacyl-[acyl-carrier-protein] synthase-1